MALFGGRQTNHLPRLALDPKPRNGRGVLPEVVDEYPGFRFVDLDRFELFECLQGR